jgi:hypothetical protein
MDTGFRPYDKVWGGREHETKGLGSGGNFRFLVR